MVSILKKKTAVLIFSRIAELYNDRIWQNIWHQVKIPQVKSRWGGGREDVDLVLSWDFSANQNRAFYMHRLANLIYSKRWGGGGA